MYTYKQVQTMRKEAGILDGTRRLARKAWKQITANSRANRIQFRKAVLDEARTKGVPVEEVVKQFGLSPDWKYKFFVKPSDLGDNKYWAYDFIFDRIHNIKPGTPLPAPAKELKITDSLRHELGHMASLRDGKITANQLAFRQLENPLTAFRRLLHPETSKLYKAEDIADKIAFGNLPWKQQLRRHPGIAGYKAAARIAAAAELTQDAAILGGGAWWLNHRRNKKNTNASDTVSAQQQK